MTSDALPREAVIHGAAEMISDLAGLARCDQGTDRDEDAVTPGQTRPVPNIAVEIADVDDPPLVKTLTDFRPDRLLSDVRPVCADRARWPRWCSLRTLQAHGRHS